jgi:hypothetical protein
VAVRAFGRPGQRPLADDVLSRLLSMMEKDRGDGLHTIPRLYGELLDATRHGPDVYRVAAVHPDPRVRRHSAVAAGWSDEDSRTALLAYPDPEVRATATALPPERMAQILDAVSS